MSVCIIYDSGTGHTKKQAEAIAEGVRSVPGAEAQLIAVADGRGAVTIGELAESGEDVPVYTLNRETLQVEIQMGVHPRITGRAMVYEVALNNGTSFKVTGNTRMRSCVRSTPPLHGQPPAMSRYALQR